MTAPSQRSWDIFCAVVDNYGDIGVCWRLARQLAGEFGLAVRLWVDDPAVLARLYPAYDPGYDGQLCEGVEVRHWPREFPAVVPAGVVVEAFACNLPERYLAAMAASPVKPLWINLEYLSAEAWVAGCHALPSPHPSLALTKYFFFPGFTPGTGGVLCEHGLPGQRAVFQCDAGQRAAWRAKCGLPNGEEDIFTVSLFCYPNPALGSLLDAWRDADEPLRCLVPAGAVGDGVARHLGAPRGVAGTLLTAGSLELFIYPFLEQRDYDRLLWDCRLNFVRGEDSFVRAQWAAHPLVWHIYPQQEDAHFAKLEAFLNRYAEGLAAPAATAWRDFSLAWNGRGEVAAAWPALRREWAALEAHALNWSGELEKLGGIAQNLVKFCNGMIK